MIAADSNSKCEQARSYYYQYLSGDTKNCIPLQMLGHIDRCSSCQADIRRLKGILTDGEEHDGGSASQTTVVATAYLRLHFSYIGAPVSCNTLKLFLPSLAIPALEVSVPTPITVHLDKCQKCTSDLETIRQLKLSDRQFTRLGQLFAEESRSNTKVCAETKNTIESIGAMAFENTSKAILKHLCVCPECRQLLYENRKSRIEALSQNSKKSPTACDSISATDIFDYVVPYGIVPDLGQPVIRSSTSHLINCPKCLNKMQKLHKTVYGILERRESGIVTCFKLDKSARSSAVGSSENLYEDWPIEVQVFDKSDKTEVIQATDTIAVGGHTTPLKPKLKQKLSSLNIRPFIKPAAAAAAIILVALLLFNAPTTARAVSLGQIRKALDRIKNICIITTHKEESNKIQEVMVSRTSNVKFLKTGNECTLLDINAKLKKTKNLNTGSIVITKLEDALLSRIKKTMEGTLDLLPYNSMSEAPEGAKWLPANENIDPGTEVYDLVWTQKSLIGSVIHRKWRVYTDIERKRPKRIEWWLKLPDEKEKLETITTISYPTDAEIQASIDKAGF
jgi:hypothetical protein